MSGGNRIRITTTTTTDIDLGIPEAAKWFSGLSDDDMAQFFCACAAEAESWEGGAERMWWFVGRHLATCECSTETGRDMIRQIARSMEVAK